MLFLHQAFGLQWGVTAILSQGVLISSHLASIACCCMKLRWTWACDTNVGCCSTASGHLKPTLATMADGWILTKWVVWESNGQRSLWSVEVFQSGWTEWLLSCTRNVANCAYKHFSASYQDLKECNNKINFILMVMQDKPWWWSWVMGFASWRWAPERGNQRDPQRPLQYPTAKHQWYFWQCKV